jgi:hypothetical protein
LVGILYLVAPLKLFSIHSELVKIRKLLEGKSDLFRLEALSELPKIRLLLEFQDERAKAALPNLNRAA